MCCWYCESGLFNFWLRFGSVTGLFKPAPSPKPRQKSKILAAHRYIISVNALISQLHVPVHASTRLRFFYNHQHRIHLKTTRGAKKLVNSSRPKKIRTTLWIVQKSVRKIPIQRPMKKLLLCSLLLSSASVVFALPAVWVNLDGRAYAGSYNNPQNNDNYQGGTNTQYSIYTGFLPQVSASGSDIASATWTQDDSVASPIGDGSSIPVTWKGDCTAQITGSASMGALHAYCYTVQEIKPFSVSYAQTDTNGNSYENTSYNPLIATASSDMGVSAQDTVTVGGTLPPGTIVHVRLGMAVDCAVTPLAPGSSSQVTAQMYCDINGFDTDPINFNTQYNGTSMSSNKVFSVAVGATFAVFQSLSADCSASSDLGNTGAYRPLSDKPPVTTASADAGNTAHFYLDVLDPGATLTAQSGHNYSTPPQLTLLATNAPAFTLSAACVPQQAWVLQYSSDMTHWTDAGTNHADDNGSLQIILPAPDVSSKFYRLRSP
jgi:hypothetical protein